MKFSIKHKFDRKSFIYFLTVFLIIPNLLSYTLALYMDVPRPVLFLEPLFAALPIFILNKRSSYFYSAILLFLFFTADILLVILSKFNFSLEKLLGFLSLDFVNFKFIENFIVTFASNDIFYLLLIVLAILLFMFTLFFLPRLYRLNLKFSVLYLVICLAVLLSANKIYMKLTGKSEIAGFMFNPLMLITPEQDWSSIYTKDFTAKPFGTPTASGILFDKAKKGALNYDKIFLIVVESFGKLENQSAQDMIESPLNDPELLKRYNVKKSKIAFKGNTVDAEFRELCQIQLDQSRLPVKEQAFKLDNCLPNILAKKGYEITMMHNSLGKPYDRENWYKDFFHADRIYFSDIIKKDFGLKPTCGTVYKGICERDLIENIFPKLFDNDKKEFLHFMTVEAHIPMDKKEEDGKKLPDILQRE